MTIAVGVDVGGTGIKVARVDTRSGALLDLPRSAPTPQPSRPDAVVDVIARLVRTLEATGAAGVGYPGVVRDGHAETAANLDPSWVGADIAAALSERTGLRVTVVNDADAAGVAEVRHGAAAHVRGTVVMVTLGTGIGTAVLRDGMLVPNTELGHLVVDGVEAETLASGRARTRPGATWRTWTADLDRFLLSLEALLWPDLFVIGGGISTDFRTFGPLLSTRTRVVPARLGNDAGIIGAALATAAGSLAEEHR